MNGKGKMVPDGKGGYKSAPASSAPAAETGSESAAIESAENAAAPAPLTLTIVPDVTNRATYTVALQVVPGVVVAADDFSEESLEQFQSAEQVAIEAQKQVIESVRVARERLKEMQTSAKGAKGDIPEAILAEINALVATINESSSAIRAAQAAQNAVWKEWATRQLKGVRVGDEFLPLESAASPVCTVPAYKAVVGALVNRAILGNSELDFLE